MMVTEGCAYVVSKASVDLQPFIIVPIPNKMLANKILRWKQQYFAFIISNAFMKKCDVRCLNFNLVIFLYNKYQSWKDARLIWRVYVDDWKELNNSFARDLASNVFLHKTNAAAVSWRSIQFD